MISSEHTARVLASVSDPSVQRDAQSWRPYLQSWKRCINDFGLDPTLSKDVPVLAQSEWRHAREQLGDKVLAYVCDELEAIMHIAGNAGYCAFFADCNGVLIGEVAATPEFHCDNERMGSVWLEAYGGTNGVGTCLVEQRPVAVFRSDHFFADFAHQACVAAPVRNALGEMIGVLNLTTRNPQILEETHRVIYHVTQQSAARLEKRFFLEAYASEFVFSFATPQGTQAHLAVNEAGMVVGANRAAQEKFAFAAGRGPLSFWDIFERDTGSSVFTMPGGKVQLRLLNDGRLIGARLRQPERSIGALSQTPVPRPISVPDASPAQASGNELELCAGRDPHMRRQVDLVRKLVGSGLPFLLLGETGVGKDTLARAIHAFSDRRHKPYIAFNCAAVPESLIDSELFGYSKGAFTGANKAGNRGRLMEANGGTLFLDEIGDMPPALQTRLLRVLESGEVSPLGAGRTIKVDLQIIAATHQDLRARIEKGEFRSDLFHRLAGLVVQVPALRERSDLGFIADSLLASFSEHGKTLSPAALRAILAHEWPGNIRELKNVLQRAIYIAEDAQIEVADLMLADADQPRRIAAPDAVPVDSHSELVDAEKHALMAVLQKFHGDVDQAATHLSINKATLYRKVKRHGIEIKAMGIR